MFKNYVKGERKLKHAQQTELMLLLGFGFAVFAKAPPELFVSFVGGLSAVSGIFVWGNRAEYAVKTPEVKP